MRIPGQVGACSEEFLANEGVVTRSHEEWQLGWHGRPGNLDGADVVSSLGENERLGIEGAHVDAGGWLVTNHRSRDTGDVPELFIREVVDLVLTFNHAFQIGVQADHFAVIALRGGGKTQQAGNLLAVGIVLGQSGEVALFHCGGHDFIGYVFYKFPYLVSVELQQSRQRRHRWILLDGVDQLFGQFLRITERRVVS